MTTSSDHENPPAAPRRMGGRAVALIFCVVVALAAALFWKHQTSAPKPAVAATPKTPPTTQTAEQVFAALPLVKGSSATDKALVDTLVKAHKKPQVATVWVNVGDALAQKMRDSQNFQYYDFAGIAYRHALQLDPKSVDAMTGMAWVVGGRHVFDQSIDWAKRALAIDPTNVAAHGIIGDAAQELGDYDQAFNEYQKMMDLRPDLSSWSRGAYLLWLTGNRSKAMWLMEKAIKAGAPYAENTAWCRAKLAIMLLQDGASLPAEQELAPALKSAPHNTHVLLAAGRIATARQDFEAAEGYYESVLEGGPNHEALASLGDLAAAQGEKEKAEEFYKKVEALHASNPVTGAHDHMLMAKFYADHDRNLVEGLRLAEQRKLSKNVIEADTLAWIYFKNGDLPHAQEAMKRALAQKTPDAEMHYHAGMIAAATGERGVAQKEIGQALSMNPQFNLLQAPLAARMLEQIAGNAANKAEPAQLATGR